MTTTILTVGFFAISLPILGLGLLRLVYLPLALAFELRPRRAAVFDSPHPTVTVVVPAFNEGPVLRNCVDSILASSYQPIDIILVDDGSTDDTLATMRCYEDHPAVTVLTRPNGGKGAALNTGIAAARGEIVLLVDADGIFTPTTVADILRGFDGPRVGAVCGNDAPVNLNRLQTHLLVVLTHVGTGFVRRALVLIGSLPIVSGNLGAFRRSVLDEVGGLREDTVGEDLELTWRVHRAGYAVTFCPHAKVHAEVPSTIRELWRQRVRWTRGYIQTARLHRDDRAYVDLRPPSCSLRRPALRRHPRTTGAQSAAGGQPGVQRPGAQRTGTRRAQDTHGPYRRHSCRSQRRSGRLDNVPVARGAGGVVSPGTHRRARSLRRRGPRVGCRATYVGRRRRLRRALRRRPPRSRGSRP